MNALLIPVEGPLQTIELVPDSNASLDQLQTLVGGNIEAVPLPEFLGTDGYHATAYVNEEGKYDPDCGPNMRATDFFAPGVGLFAGDYIAGPLLLCGFDPETGEHAELPQSVIDRARLIEEEAG